MTFVTLWITLLGLISLQCSHSWLPRLSSSSVFLHRMNSASNLYNFSLTHVCGRTSWLSLNLYINSLTDLKTYSTNPLFSLLRQLPCKELNLFIKNGSSKLITSEWPELAYLKVFTKLSKWLYLEITLIKSYLHEFCIKSLYIILQKKI